MQSSSVRNVVVFMMMVLLCTISFIQCDLPLHCVHQQIHGEWMIFTSTFNHTAKTPLHCERENRKSFDVQDSFVVSLQYPNIVKVGRRAVGTWTMMYDQGFEFTVRHKKFFAFNNFVKVPNSQLITSYCAETTYGWMEMFHPNNQSVSYGCYTARKINEKKNDTVTDLPVNVKLYKSEEEHKELNTHGDEDSTLSDDYFVTESDLIQEINSKQKLWTAGIYPEFEKMTKKHLKAKLGHSILYRDDLKRKSHRRPARPSDEVTQESDEDSILSDNMSMGFDTPKKATKLPKSWDWRNVSGVNYVSPVRDQGGCGSCYTFAALAALESRIRILTNNQEQVILAPQDVISCSAYNQNCSGGFPYVVGKQVHDFSLVPEDCFKYQQSAVPCSKKCTNPRLTVTVKRDSYKYLGGYYGASNADNMMEEIYKNGPIPISYLIYPDFKYYKKGIYQNVKAEKVNRKAHLINDFEATTHSVALVGWGEENGVPFWIAKNSWGTYWGEQGYFRIKRGVDEAAVEAEAVTPGIPVLQYHHRSKQQQHHKK